MVLSILRWPDPLLSEVCDPVQTNDPELGGLAGEMLDTMYAAGGRGLAAPQIGRTIRVFVMDVDWKDGTRRPWVFLNPRILERSDETATTEEGCLSIPGITVPVTRPVRVRLAWSGLDGAERDRAFDGFAAVCIQHELDHLDGVVTLDHLPPGDRARFEAEIGG